MSDRHLEIRTVHLNEGIGHIAGASTSLSVRGQAYGGSRPVDLIERFVPSGYLIGYEGRLYLIHESKISHVEVVDLDGAQRELRPPLGQIIEPAPLATAP